MDSVGIHVITPGQSDLASHIYMVVLLVISTWATVEDLGAMKMRL